MTPPDDIEEVEYEQEDVPDTDLDVEVLELEEDIWELAPVENATPWWWKL